MNSRVVRELELSVAEPWLSDLWSYETERIYFDAAAFHGFEIEHDNVPDIYSYALEAAEALSKLEPVWDVPEALASACRDWHEGRLSKSHFLQRVTELCEREARGLGKRGPA